MTKRCPCCNVNYKKTAVRCVSCGCILDEIRMPRKKKILLLTLLITASILLASLSAAAVVSYRTGPRGRVHYIMNQMMDNNVDEVFATLPDFLMEGEVDYNDPDTMHLIAYVEKMSNYVYSFYSDPAVVPNSTQREELMETIRPYVDEDFDESLIEDVSMVWVDYRGGRRGFWRSVDLRFVMIFYKGEWCWWPYY